MARARKPPNPLAQATKIVKAQYAPVDYQIGRAEKRADQENAALRAATADFVKLLQGGVAPAGQVYDSAVQQQQGLAQGAAQLLAQANPNVQLQQQLDQINAPQEQRDQLASSLQSQFPGAGAVLNIAQGAIPGESLLSQKSASQQFLAGLPTVAALSGQQSLRGLLASQADTQDKLNAARLEIGGQLPGLTTQLSQRAEDVAFRQQQERNDILEAARDRQFRADQARIDFLRSQQLTPYQKASLRIDQQRLNADIAASKQESALGGDSGLQYQNNPDGSIDIFNPNTGQIQRVQGPDKGRDAGLTPYQKLQRADTRGRAFDDAKEVVRQRVGLEPGGNVEPVILNGRQIGIRIDGKRFDFTSRKRAYDYLYSSVAGPLLRTGVTKSSVRAMLNTALNQAGFAVGKRDSSGRRPGGKPRKYGGSASGSIFGG